jgi:hypothetical protein
VLQDFVSDSELLKRMNATRRNRQIDRPSAHNVALTRIGSALVKIDVVPASPQVRGD